MVEVQFNEKFMEDCIKENPLVFLGEDFNFKFQQYELHGFYPDLIFEDANGRVTIVEVQQKALDRLHLYKSLEYRDLMHKSIGYPPRIIVYCNSLRERHAPLLMTHNIECIHLEKDQFIELAKKNCPGLYKKASVTKPEEIGIDHNRINETPRGRFEYEFRRKPWYEFEAPSYYIKHYYLEIGRLGIMEDEHFYRSRYNLTDDLDAFFDGETDNSEAREALYNLSPLNFDLLKSRGETGYRCALGNEFAKPRIDLIPYITTKGNLSVCWRPTDWGNPYGKECDWQYWFSMVERSFKRPIDELMFIRGVNLLRPDPKTDYGPLLKYNKPALDSILICAVRAAFNRLVYQLSEFFEVRKINDFDFILDESEDEDIRGSVINWNLNNVKDREDEQESEWLENFEDAYGISLEIFLDLYANCLRKKRTGPKRLEVNKVKYASKDMKENGYRKMTEGVVKSIVDRLKSKHQYLFKQIS